MVQLTQTGENVRRKVPTPVVAGAIAACLVLAVGCSPLRQRREAVEPSGFLGDYSQLAKNDQFPAYLIYINQTANWSRYNAIILDSVTLWGSAGDKLSEEDRQKITGIAYNALYDTLNKNFTIVNTAGPNVIRLRAAITQAQGSKVALNVVTSIIPQLRVLTTVGGMAADTANVVGESSAELEALDSVTLQRLAAAVDRQTGTKALIRGHKFSTWGDLQDACNYWGDRLDKFLVERGVRQKVAAQ